MYTISVKLQSGHTQTRLPSHHHRVHEHLAIEGIHRTLRSAHAHTHRSTSPFFLSDRKFRDFFKKKDTFEPLEVRFNIERAILKGQLSACLLICPVCVCSMTKEVLSSPTDVLIIDRKESATSSKNFHLEELTHVCVCCKNIRWCRTLHATSAANHRKGFLEILFCLDIHSGLCILVQLWSTLT